MKSWLLVLPCVLLTAGTCLQAAELPSVRARPGVTANSVPSITLTSDAEERVKPDLATLSLEASDERSTAAAAAVENARLTTTVLATLQRYGLTAPDMQAGALDLSPQYRERKDPKSGEVIDRTFTGYRASTTYRVQVHKVDDAPRIAREIVQGGSNLYRGLTFEVLDRDDRLEALRAKALQTALRRGQRYAKAASLALGDIIQIAPGPYQAARVNEARDNAAGQLGQVAMSVPAQVNDIMLQASVMVSWELKPQSEVCGTGQEHR